MAQKGKRYKSAADAVDVDKTYSPKDAVAVVKVGAKAKFDETIEAHFRLGIDPRQADQSLRGTISLPNGTGKNIRVAVFAEGEKAKEATDAGAELVGLAELAADIEKGKMDFDACIATPDVMGTVGKLGRALGPRGLMPNPKVGTVTFDVAKAVKDIKAGKVEYRNDKFGICHVPIGKASFDEQALLENYASVVDEIMRAKPSGSKGKYVKSIFMTSTMGPSARVDSIATKDILEDSE